MSWFLDDEGGYTSLSVALALLVSFTLAFSLLQVRWVASTSSAAQTVADAVALSGEQVVRAFTTVADVCDASVTTLGVCALVTIGVGLVTAAIPGCGSQGVAIVKKGREIATARTRFARSAAEGLQKLEAALPALIVADSYATAKANSAGSVSFSGVAIPYPFDSESEYGTIPEIDDSEVESRAEELAEQSDELQEADERAAEAKLRAYRADCVDDPMCMRSRAASLAGLSATANPSYATVGVWTFGAAVLRARAYYRARIANETPASSDPKDVMRSRLRLAFYTYALAQANASSYRETAGSVALDLKDLPRNTETTRRTSLYTERSWPYSTDGGVSTLHAYEGCPASTGVAGYGSLAEQEAGTYAYCETCCLSVTEMGRVASASTNIDNGFEYYWRIVREAAEEYEDAREEVIEGQEVLKADAAEAGESYVKAVSSVGSTGIKLRPAGALGCIGVVIRGAVSSPAELSKAFTSGVDLPAGATVSAATLAPDATSSGSTVLAHVLDSVASSDSTGVGGVMQAITTLWGEALRAYNGAYDTVSNAVNSVFEGIDQLGAGTVADWLRSKLASVVVELGLAPPDLRQKKPVLCSTGEVLDAAGVTDVNRIRNYLLAMPEDGTPSEYVQAFGKTLFAEMREDGFVLAEIPIPGTELTVPLTIDLSALAGLS